MPGILDTKAVGAQDGDNAREIFSAFRETPGLVMVHEAAPQHGKTSNPNGAVDPLPK